MFFHENDSHEMHFEQIRKPLTICQFPVLILVASEKLLTKGNDVYTYNYASATNKT